MISPPAVPRGSVVETRVVSRVKKGKEAEGQKFADYFEFAQAPSGMPSESIAR